MKTQIITKVINSDELKDVPLLHVIKTISVIMECEYDYKNRSKKNRSSNTDEVLVVIQ